MKFQAVVDAKGLRCPLPLLKARQALNTINSGDLLEVITTDSQSLKDFESFVHLSKHDLHDSYEQNGMFHIILRKF